MNNTGNIRPAVEACRRLLEQADLGHVQLQRVVPHYDPTEAGGQQMPSIDHILQPVEDVAQAP